MLSLYDPVTALSGVGPKRKKLYQKLGIETVDDLLHFYPRRYDDFSHPLPLDQWQTETTGLVEGTLLKKYPPAYIRKGMVLYKGLITDGFSRCQITFFNNEYALKGMSLGESYLFSGKLVKSLSGYQMTVTTVVSKEEKETFRPIYRLTEGLPLKGVIHNIKDALTAYLPLVAEQLPPALISRYRLLPIRDALWSIHFPKDQTALAEAKRRLSFEELFFFSLALFLLKGRPKENTRIRIAACSMSPFYQSLPFSLTDCQKRSIDEILKDFSSPHPMRRLLQGDVGSGKTVVAAAACYAAAQSGYQSALMAPTEILAAQHEKTFRDMLCPLGIRICLLTGSLSQKEKAALRAGIQNGDFDVVIGTHALFQQSTLFSRLGLVITDEQHRFGVRQREALTQKGDAPHHLVMSATPIPRTLALMLYGDLDLSVLDQRPAGRKPVETFVIHSDKRTRALHFLRKQIEQGGQAYIVCPLIEEGVGELTAATRYAEELKETVFWGISVGLLHGKMSAEEKEAVMSAFSRGEISLLVATTVIEVGVDVPNANVILIENAERFGLSQLHQLRGRVGRGERESYCILLSDHDNPDTRRRLAVMRKSNDGFFIAKQDLKLRGAGDFFGEKQHGVPVLGIADLMEDSLLFQTAREEARSLLKEDPKLEKEEHRPLWEKVQHDWIQKKLWTE